MIRRNFVIVCLLLYCISFARSTELSVHGSEYIKYDLLGTNTSIVGTSDTLSLQFKTVEPHGLLFYAHGVGYITLELYHCKLRYTINMGEEFSFFFGDKLCDNQWHSVRITRDKHKLTVHLDKEQTKIVNIKMPKRLESQITLRINIRIYVGGTWKTTNEMKNEIVGNFVGCLSDVLFNAYHLISDAQKKKKGYTTTGAISYTCPAMEYKPVGFPNEYAYLKFPSPDRNNVSVQFKFRTYDESGILMYRDGSKISVWLYLKNGKLKFEFYVPGKNLVTLDTDAWLDADFNDGEWHSVKASLDPVEMIFEVDNGKLIKTDAHAVLLSQTKNLDFENFTHVGGGTYYKGMYGFVGCMENLHVNGAKINVSKLHKEITAVQVELGKCALQSRCYPSSCQYKSTCEQRSDNFTCHCKRFYSGRFCQVPMFQTTCQGYKELGLKEDAHCTLDPDGKGSLPEFKVLCNMTSKSNDAITIVKHSTSTKQKNVRDEADHFSPAARSWGHKLDYGVDLKGLRAMIDESDHCRQYVEFNCIDTKFLTPRGNDLPGAFWVSESGVERHYWGGAKLGGVTCACGRTNSCHDRTKTCNCDTGDSIWRQDSGYLTNKDHLPVASLYFPMSAGKSNFSVGPLECFGRRKTLTRETDEQKFFGIACELLVTKPPPVFPWQQNKLTTTTKPKWPQKTTKILSTAEKNINSTNLQLTSGGIKTSTLSLNLTYANTTASNASNITNVLFARTTVKYGSSFFSQNPTEHVLLDVGNVQNQQKNPKGDWWFILIVTTASCILMVALVLVVLVFRHKKKNGVWCKGLFMFTKEVPLPKIEIYRHSIGTDSPDILHMEDFKNTKVVDLHLHRGRFVAKKSVTKKKTVTFKDRC